MHARRGPIVAVTVIVLIAIGVMICVLAVPKNGPDTIFDTRLSDDGRLVYIDVKGDYRFNHYLEHGSSDVDLGDFYDYLRDNITCGKPINGVNPVNCSAFEASDSDGSGFLVGRNFDFRYSMPGVVYTHADGCYRSMSLVDMRMFVDTDEEYSKIATDVRLNAAPYIPLDGVNEKGVFVCVNMVHFGDVMDMKGKTPIFATSALRLILDKADSTESAVRLVENYSLKSDVCYHFFVTDRTGDSRSIEVIDGRIESTPTELMTNHYIFPDTGVPVSENSKYRYDIIKASLDSSDIMDDDQVRDVLSSVKQDDPDLVHYTRWSVVYDTEELSATVYLRSGDSMDYAHPFHLKLIET